MRERYETLSLATLRDLAKARGLKGISTLKKAELIDVMVEADRKEKEAEQPKEIQELKKVQESKETQELRKIQESKETQESKEKNDRTKTVDPAKVQEFKDAKSPIDTAQLDSGQKAHGILEVMPDGYGFIRSENYLPGENDIYVSPSQIRRFNLKTGDVLQGNIRVQTQSEKFSALLYVNSVNDRNPNESVKRFNFEDMTPIFPNERVVLERPGGSMAMRIVDLISPIGKGQRGMIVSPPKAGKTTLLKDVAKSLLRNNPNMHLLILLIDERP